jgi:hypothetical protein
MNITHVSLTYYDGAAMKGFRKISEGNVLDHVTTNVDHHVTHTCT